MYYHELDKSAVLQQNKELRGQKRILEDNVVNENGKLQQALARSEKSCGHDEKIAKMNKKN